MSYCLFSFALFIPETIFGLKICQFSKIDYFQLIVVEKILKKKMTKIFLIEKKILYSRYINTNTKIKKIFFYCFGLDVFKFNFE